MTQILSERGGTEHLGMWGIPSFYPTPRALTKHMMDWVSIQSGERILEPSAGKGNIAREILAVHPDNPIVLIEKNPLLRAVLTATFGHRRVAKVADFFDYTDPADVIIMNPPFSANYQDADHVQHAWSLLAPKGRLAAVVHYYTAGKEWQRPDYKPARFQAWMRQRNFTVIENSPFAFTHSDHPTNVRTCLVLGEKP